MADRTVRDVVEVMGTVFSFAIQDQDGRWPAVRPAVALWLKHVDETFSTYKADSYISRMSSGEVTLTDCPDEVHEVDELCRRIEQDTCGFFSAHYPQRFDPTGVVKGWAAERVSRMLTETGLPRHLVNGAGDIQLGAGPAEPDDWWVGIAHPLRPKDLVAIVKGRNMAVATSGNAERGAHIINPHTDLPAMELASVTLTGAQLSVLDGYATAAFAMGDGALDWIEGLADVEGCVVTRTGQVLHTAGFLSGGQMI